MSLKRQYRINRGAMEYMIESSMNIHDDILQRELSRTSDEKMKHIVATIQQEQNAIIRNVTSRELIIQGVAGSGKTSVALHRIAFLLYRNKETLTSPQILILSPNKVFSDYISSVLPELGEEHIPEIGMEDIAVSELGEKCSFQKFGEQVEELAQGADMSLIERIRYKARIEMVHEIDRFIEYVGSAWFVPEAIVLDQAFLSRDAVSEAYNASSRLPVKLRLEKTARTLAETARDDQGARLRPSAFQKIYSAVKKMFHTHSILSLYKMFYEFIGKPELFRLRPKGKLEYADVFPLVYMKIVFEGKAPYDTVKHLVVDEMQDYTPVQYAVLARLYPCKKTILGDAGQSLNPYSSSSLALIKLVFPGADTFELLKSYRSTMEIIAFARRILPESPIQPIERHGEEPRLIGTEEPAEELHRIRGMIGQFPRTGFRSMGIICKSSSWAEQLYQALGATEPRVHLLDSNSRKYEEGIMIASAQMAKGLEFDQVLVPFANAEHYSTEMDRSLLYIACTRAMHRLTLTYSGEASRLVPRNSEET